MIENAQLSLPLFEGTKLSDTGAIFVDDIKQAAWAHALEHFEGYRSSSEWWLGDAVLFGREHFRDTYKDALRHCTFSESMLNNCAWVAKVFAPERRRGNLSFAHHLEVASQIKEVRDQDRWLDKAERDGLTRDGLRKAMRVSLATYKDPAGRIAKFVVQEWAMQFVRYWERNNFETSNDGLKLMALFAAVQPAYKKLKILAEKVGERE